MAIYFIQCGNNGPIKIGYTDNGVEDRLKQLQTGCPYELKLLWVYAGNDYKESEIHDLFKHELIRGEWFRPAQMIFDFIKENLKNITIFYAPNRNYEIIITESIHGISVSLPDVEVFDYDINGIFIAPEHPDINKIKLYIDGCIEHREIVDKIRIAILNKGLY